MDLFSSLYALEFCSFSSGSSGNCYYIGNQDSAILIDAGLSSRKIKKHLNEIGRRLADIKAIFITHDHIDHIKGVQELTLSHKIPLYATAHTLSGIELNRFTNQADKNCFRPINFESPIIIGDIRIIAFEVEHDAKGAAGFHIENSHQKITLATDLGHISHRAANYLRKANIMILESNYDEEMLARGPYPPYLQERIRGSKGHLGNHQVAEFLANHIQEHTSHVFLAHLSEHNNSVEKALFAAESAFNEMPYRPKINCLNRKQRSDFFRFTVMSG